MQLLFICADVVYEGVGPMRVGIITLEDYTNYGNRLQNYALCTLVKELGCEVYSGLTCFEKSEWVRTEKSRSKRIIKQMLPFALYKKHVERSLDKYESCRNKLMDERIRKFKQFTRSYTECMPVLVVKDDSDLARKLNEKSYDFFITGSDQVWNPIYRENSFYFLTFAPPGKRLSFAASISSDKISEADKLLYSRYFREMKYISVREESAAQLIKQISGRYADVTLDPTLLLSAEQWNQVIRKPSVELDEDYICTYFLGEVPKCVQEFADQKNLKVLQLNSMENPELFSIDPAEFMYILKNSKYVLTDSFHAVVFSVIFHKEFYVFRRQQKGLANMFSRIESITKKLNLENHIQDRRFIVEQNAIENWKKIDSFLQQERSISISMLKQVMGMI